jgi:uncharacterized protein YbjT (DUF2867 family)
MRILLFGATGMIGQAALRECLLADDVGEVVAIGRAPTGQTHPRLTELVHDDLWHCDAVADRLDGFDACFFCIGRTSSGMDEARYTHFTFDMTLAAAAVLARLNPQMTFVYVSGAGADSSGQGRAMWARVRGRTENALQRLPFKAVYAIRPGVIQPLHGIRSRTASYRWFYLLGGPLLPLLRALLPNTVLSTDIVARALLTLARTGWPEPVLEAADIAAAGRVSA